MPWRSKHSDGITSIHISRAALDAISAHARDAAPEECCGLLLGLDAHILEALPSTNLAADRTRHFLIDPRVHFQAIRSSREGRGHPILGFYHSHPFSEPVPSTSDAAGASYTDYWYLIVRPAAEGCLARLFRFDGRFFVETALEIEG